ncbi:DUF6131 family protein [Streptomyces werraensis]
MAGSAHSSAAARDAVIGAILWIMGSMGHAVAGRRHYW